MPFEDRTIPVVDASRNYLSNKFVGMINGIDRFFGNSANFKESSDSVLQIDMTRVAGYNGEHRVVFQGFAKVRLPNTEKRLKLLIESDPDTNTANATKKIHTGVAPVNTAPPKSYGIGLRNELRSPNKRWFLGTDGGVKVAGLNSSLFMRMGGSYTLPMNKWQMKASQTVFWFNSTGAGETTQLTFDRPFNDTNLFRATSSDTWLNNTQTFDLRQDFSVYHPMTDRIASLYQASVIGIGTNRLETHVTDYVLLMQYRHRLHRKWTYLVVSPQLHFPESHGYKASGELIVRLEILFDSSR